MPFVEITASGYLFGGVVSTCCLLGGLVIRQDRSRITKMEEKQDEDGALLHEIKGEIKGLHDKIDATRDGLDGKMDVIIHTLNGGKKKDK